MQGIGVIAEFNPFHNGHKFLLNEASNKGAVVCVMSGNFVQRGDLAIVDKRLRAEAALKNGADVVIELPICYALSTAQNFAFGAVSILKSIGCGALVFGSECGDIEIIKNAANILCSSEYKNKIELYLSQGLTFAAARQKASGDLDVLSSPNDNLAVEYFSAAEKIKADFDFCPVKRQGVCHDSPVSCNSFASGSFIRKEILDNPNGSFLKFIPENTQGIYKRENIADIRKIENAVLAVLRMKSLSDLKNLPDLSEGIENRLFSSIRVAKTLDGLYNGVKSKRYTLARIRRLVLSSFLGIDDLFFLKTPPYMRILGFNKTGEHYLSEKIARSDIPVILRCREIDGLDENAKKLFAAECRATDMFSLATGETNPCGAEFTSKLIRMR